VLPSLSVTKTSTPSLTIPHSASDVETASLQHGPQSSQITTLDTSISPITPCEFDDNARTNPARQTFSQQGVHNAPSVTLSIDRHSPIPLIADCNSVRIPTGQNVTLNESTPQESATRDEARASSAGLPIPSGVARTMLAHLRNKSLTSADFEGMRSRPGFDITGPVDVDVSVRAETALEFSNPTAVGASANVVASLSHFNSPAHLSARHVPDTPIPPRAAAVSTPQTSFTSLPNGFLDLPSSVISAMTSQTSSGDIAFLTTSTENLTSDRGRTILTRLLNAAVDKLYTTMTDPGFLENPASPVSLDLQRTFRAAQKYGIKLKSLERGLLQRPLGRSQQRQDHQPSGPSGVQPQSANRSNQAIQLEQSPAPLIRRNGARTTVTPTNVTQVAGPSRMPVEEHSFENRSSVSGPDERLTDEMKFISDSLGSVW
jgi:hypothetical protein